MKTQKNLATRPQIESYQTFGGMHEIVLNSFWFYCIKQNVFWWKFMKEKHYNESFILWCFMRYRWHRLLLCCMWCLHMKWKRCKAKKVQINLHSSQVIKSYAIKLSVLKFIKFTICELLNLAIIFWFIMYGPVRVCQWVSLHIVESMKRKRERKTRTLNLFCRIRQWRYENPQFNELDAEYFITRLCFNVRIKCACLYLLEMAKR